MVNNTQTSADLTVPGPAPTWQRVELLGFLVKNGPELPHGDLLRKVASNDPEALAGWVLAVLKDFMWRPASTPPATRNTKPGEAIALLGVIDDPAYRTSDARDAFVDVVHYWPHERRWTITHCTRADGDAGDHPVKVAAWKPLDQPPPPWSALWA